MAPLAPTANCNNLLAGALARGVTFGLFVLAFAPLVLVTPAHAADDNTVSITVNPAAQLTQQGDFYKATTNVTVKTSKPYGFDLTMKADGNGDLVNTVDPSHRISNMQNDSGYRGIEGIPANSWGYYMYDWHHNITVRPVYGHVPAAKDNETTLLSVTAAEQKGCSTNHSNCSKDVVFAANIDPSKLASGSYSASIMYTATAKPKPAPIVEPTVCKSGDPKNDCQVDLDPNMIPVKYTGSTTNAQWTSLANPEDSYSIGEWYNYSQKQWANAVTVKDPSKYKGKSIVVDQADILGYWVYIPRYAYEVMRRDGTDKPVDEQDFLISFEKKTTPKRRPAVCPEKGKDYRTECSLNRDYIKGQPSNAGTWATHPAFTFGTKELNGIWFAKFETTGTSKQPTILPNERAMSWDAAVESMGNKYVTATTLGVKDSQNTGGNNNFTPPAQNSHHLAELSSRMSKNVDWGAVAYLSASRFGVGYKGVQPNAAQSFKYDPNSDCDDKQADSDGRCSLDITGCGPIADGNGKEIYIDLGDYGQQSACSKSNLQRAYNGSIGQLASTTNNPTGVYDMAGGGMEYVSASYTNDVNLINSSTETEHKYMLAPAHKPYVDLYNFNTFAKCTWATCGGQGTYEVTKKFNDDKGAWNGLSSYAPASDNIKRDWATRGANAFGIPYGWAAGVFDSDSGFSGVNGINVSLRIVLSSRPV